MSRVTRRLAHYVLCALSFCLVACVGIWMLRSFDNKPQLPPGVTHLVRRGLIIAIRFNDGCPATEELRSYLASHNIATQPVGIVEIIGGTLSQEQFEIVVHNTRCRAIAVRNARILGAFRPTLPIAGKSLICDFGLSTTVQPSDVDFSESASLVFLSLRQVDIGDQVVESLAPLPKLHYLDLCGTGVTDRCVDALIACAPLWDVDLNGTAVSENAIERLRTARPDLHIQH